MDRIVGSRPMTLLFRYRQRLENGGYWLICIFFSFFFKDITIQMVIKLASDMLN